MNVFVYTTDPTTSTHPIPFPFFPHKSLSILYSPFCDVKVKYSHTHNTHYSKQRNTTFKSKSGPLFTTSTITSCRFYFSSSRVLFLSFHFQTKVHIFNPKKPTFFKFTQDMCEGFKKTEKGTFKMTKLDFLKFLKPQEPKNGVFGCFLFSICLILCLFLLDYKIVNGFLGQSLLVNLFKFKESLPKVGFLELESGSCDIFDGNWVWDESYPLYQAQDCLFLDEGFRCTENGRPDKLYTKWRWQPKDCNLPRFNATLMLEKLRNKRVVFVGDSIGRNQWESLLCMLSSAIPNKTSIYEVNGNPITKHTGSLVFKFADFNCTIEYYRAPFLVLQSRAPASAPKNVTLTIKLDKLDWSAGLWKGADLLVFNAGHWWNYEKTIRGGWYFQDGAEIKVEMSVESAFHRSIKTLVDWINHEVNTSKTHVIFRTYAPVHFRGGDWKTGGSCHLETLPDLSAPKTLSETYTEFKTTMTALSQYGKVENSIMDLLNVTGMSSQRKDGHSSLYYLGPVVGVAPLHRQDCSHWCLPGVPDTWNELLYALLLKRLISRG